MGVTKEITEAQHFMIRAFLDENEGEFDRFIITAPDDRANIVVEFVGGSRGGDSYVITPDGDTDA